MSEQWAVRLRVTDATSLGRVRQWPGLEVCEHREELWLRVLDLDEDLDSAIKVLPGTRFRILPDGQLVRFGEHVPKGHLPEGPWVELSKWMDLEADPPVFCGMVTNRISLQLVRGGEPAEANVLLTTAKQWREYATNSPQIRLDRWAFAMSDDGQVVICGTPLPPLPGTRFVERSGVATATGWTWTPMVDADVVRTVIGLGPEDLALLDVSGNWDHIKFDEFVRATRSAVRESPE